MATFKDLCDGVPVANQWKLDRKIDFEHDGVPKHLDEIASVMDEWEGVAIELGFTDDDLAAILRKGILQLWLERKGDKATYRNLIGMFVKAGKTGYAKAVCGLLGSYSGHVKPLTRNLVTIEDYCECIPEVNRWKLDCKIDFEHDGVSKHLDKIASVMDEWEGGVADKLGLTKANISAIKLKHKDDLRLQTKEALQLWQEKNGLKATYRNLIGIFIKAGKTSFAEAVCETLEGYNKKTKILIKQNELRKKAVKQNEEKIIQLFANLVNQVCNTLVELNLDMDGFHLYLTHLFLGMHVPQLPKVATYFTFLAEKCLWSYSHYSPLEGIAETFAKTQTEPHLASYKEQLGGFYSTTKLLDYITACQDDAALADPKAHKASLETEKLDRDYYRKLTVKLERQITNETLQYIDDLWRALAEFFVLPSLTALLDRVVAGSLIVTWQIPDVFAMQIRFNGSGVEAESFYRRHEIVEVKIDDDFVYQDKRRDHYFKVVLLQLCENGDVGRMLELLEKMTDFDFSQFDYTPLGVATKNGRIDIVQILLLYGIDVNGRDKLGFTPLMTASEYGRTNIAELLINHNADVNARIGDGGTALMVASQFGSTDVVELLIKHNADVNAVDKDGTTSLMYACLMGKLDVAELLLKHNANVNASWRKKEGATALMLASQEGFADIVELLLNHNADVNATLHGGSGATALQLASMEGRTDVVELLIKHNADVNAREETDFTALMVAVGGGHVEIVKKLLAANADTNIIEKETQWTPLFYAAETGHAEITTLLIEHGTDVTYKDKHGATAIDVARTHNHQDIVDLLIAFNMSLEQEAQSSSVEQEPLSEEIKKHILESGDYLNNYINKIFSRRTALSQKGLGFIPPQLEREEIGIWS